MKKNILVLLIGSIYMIGCSSDSESDLVTPPVDDNENQLITYNGNIRSVISGNCLSCHSEPPVNGAPFGLATYDQVKSVAESGSLLAAISKQTGEPRAMPPSGRLPQATIDLVAEWINNGTPED